LYACVCLCVCVCVCVCVPRLALGAGYAVASYEAVRVVQSLAADPSLLLQASPYLPACVAGLWLYRWAFALLWTVGFFAATEGDSARLLRANGTRFTAGLFGFATGKRGRSSTVGHGSGGGGMGEGGEPGGVARGGDGGGVGLYDDDGGWDDDADNLDALLLPDDDDELLP
jgi:hypothetical protein